MKHLLIIVAVPVLFVLAHIAIDKYYSWKERRHGKSKVKKLPKVVDISLDEFERKIS